MPRESAYCPGGITSLKYDPFGRRVHQSGTSATTTYVYDGDNLAEELNSSIPTASYTYSLNVDEPLSVMRASTPSYFNEDGLGSVTSLANLSGGIVQSYMSDSFGKLVATSGSLPNALQYTARESDPQLNLYYYRTRYDDAQIGRFINEDPMNLSVGLNFYKYVENNPLLFKDPFGLRWYNTGKPADPDTNTIVCNGKGGIKPQLAHSFDLLPDVRRCIGDCVERHEERHIRDAMASNPKVCIGIADGIQVTSSPVQHNASEVAGYTISVNCLINKQKNNKCDLCTKWINDQLESDQQQLRIYQLEVKTDNILKNSR